MANKFKTAMTFGLPIGFIAFAVHNGGTGFLNLLNFLGSVFHGSEFANYIGLSFRQFGKDVAMFTGPATPIEMQSLLLGVGVFSLTTATVFLILTRHYVAIAQNK
ncbi:hypothetical protein [Pseudodesulfovibrio piezophilus]|uniref:hypothetical protein n=1 Tax=Pseudodesulfovibrio piezophilus TaxID=879567 RepID=UPI00059F28B4|nr:hypothetical protein [Pseudodesulfovibrio piezophilus]